MRLAAELRPVFARTLQASASSSNLLLVTSPGPDHRLGGEVAFGLGPGIAPANVPGDGLALLSVGVMVGAVEREVPQGGEFGFDPVQPGGVCGQEHELDVAGGGPAGDLGVLVRGEGEVVRDQVELLPGPAPAEQLEEGQELPPPLARPDPIGDLAAGQ